MYLLNYNHHVMQFLIILRNDANDKFHEGIDQKICNTSI